MSHSKKMRTNTHRQKSKTKQSREKRSQGTSLLHDNPQCLTKCTPLKPKDRHIEFWGVLHSQHKSSKKTGPWLKDVLNG